MEKDIRFRAVKSMIKTGEIKNFQEIARIAVKINLTAALRTNNNRMGRLIENPKELTLIEIETLAKLFGIDLETLAVLIIRGESKSVEQVTNKGRNYKIK